jgi:N-acetylneuraminic acid mutarotase
MRALVLAALGMIGCAKVWGFEEPVLDAGPPAVVREPCFENDKIERRSCAGGESSRLCTPDGWSSWSACAKPGFRAMAAAPIKGRIWHSMVWTGDELIVWGGRGPEEAFNDGAAYDPVKDTWRVIAPAPLSPRVDHAAIWMGTQMLVWGGRIDGAPSTTYFADGATYDPRTNTWERVAGSPMSARARVAAVWSTTTREVLLWGGIYEFDFYSADGAAFDPTTRKWTHLSITTATPRAAQSSFWDGTRMVVVGGECRGFAAKPCNDVWAYEPAGGLWEQLAPFPSWYGPNQSYAFTVAGKSSMALFGGEKTTTKYGNGALFDAASKSFTQIAAPTTELGPTPARVFATAFFADSKLWIHGGSTGTTFDDHSATWDPATATWSPAITELGPRMAASAISTHDDTFVWGGRRDDAVLETFVNLNDGRVLRHTP